ncbi:MAG: DUF4139 domain-containing protein [Deltaproteobacteria bacterium]|nr:DUF4139 domain-containing protein [Deltaproteobacteria bacterium]
MRRLLLLASLTGLALAACGGTPKPKHPPGSDGPATDRVSTSAQRERVAVTIYNQGFGLVREVRDVDLAKGRVALEYRDVAEHVQPETVSLKSLDGADLLSVFEQNYRYDLLTPEKLLEKHIGKKVRLYRWNEAKGVEEGFDAKVLSVEGGIPVYELGGEITYGFPGRVAFPDVPKDLLSKPTLVWLLGSGRDKQKLELTYLTSQMTWRCDYVMVIDDKDASADLTGWVTLDNKSGVAFENAQLRLVAGDVNKVAPAADAYDEGLDDEEKEYAKKDEGGFSEEAFFEYHLYTLGRPTTLLNREQKQATLLESNGVAVKKKLIFSGASYWYRGKYGQVVTNQKVSVFLDLENSEKNKLGVPLPKGIVRVYKSDSSGARQFIGEDRIDHTPRDEKIRVKMGEAFDVVADRKQMSWKPLGSCTSETEWETEIRNHKDTPIEVELVEPVGGDWQVVQSSLPAKKQDAHTFTFDARVPARGKTTVTYRVQVRWC